jgi:hypothetical protein
MQMMRAPYRRRGDIGTSMKELIETIKGLRLRGIGFRSLTEAQRRNASVTDLAPAPLNLGLPPRRCGALQLVARGRFSSGSRFAHGVTALAFNCSGDPV